MFSYFYYYISIFAVFAVFSCNRVEREARERELVKFDIKRRALVDERAGTLNPVLRNLWGYYYSPFDHLQKVDQ